LSYHVIVVFPWHLKYKGMEASLFLLLVSFDMFNCVTRNIHMS